MQLLDRSFRSSRKYIDKVADVPLGAVEFVADHVPVIFSDKFQQSMLYVLMLPLIQFIFRVSDFPVVQQRQVPTVQTSRSKRSSW